MSNSTRFFLEDLFFFGVKNVGPSQELVLPSFKILFTDETYTHVASLVD
jgi:hypothetical protein